MTGADASDALGAHEVAGSFVNPRGLARKLSAPAKRPASSAPDPAVPDLPRFGRVGYLSVTRDEVAILRARTGLRARITGEVLARAPRSAISGVEFDAGRLLSHLTISFDDDVVWELDIPKVNKRTAEGVARELGGRGRGSRAT